MHLLGPSGDEVKSRRVPLRLVLMYDNMHRVQNQEILKLSPDSKLVIDEHGKATLRVRIEEVSKNHQKQARYIQLSFSFFFMPLKGWVLRGFLFYSFFFVLFNLSNAALAEYQKC